MGVDEGTVRRRVSRWEKSGFLRGWVIFLNPELIGLALAQLWFDTFSNSGKEDVIKKLRLIDGVVVITNHIGNSMYVAMLYDNEGTFRRRLELIQRLANPEDLYYSTVRLPACTVQLSDTDLRILRLIQRKPRLPYAEISTRLGISTRTAKRRLSSLVKGRAVFVLPSMDPKQLDGATVADLLVRYSDPKLKGAVDEEISRRFEERLVRAEVGGYDMSFFNFFVTNVAQAQGILNIVEDKPGVASARIDLVQDRVELYEVLRKSMDIPLKGQLLQQELA